MKKLLKNWKTTLAGLAAIVTGAALIAKGQLIEGIAAITTGLGLSAAKDFDKTGL